MYFSPPVEVARALCYRRATEDMVAKPRLKKEGATTQRLVPPRRTCVGCLTRCSALGSVAAALLAYFAGALLPTSPKPTDPDVAALDARFGAAIAAASGLSVSTKGLCVAWRLRTQLWPVSAAHYLLRDLSCSARQLPARSRHALLEAVHRQVRRQPEHAVHVEHAAARRAPAPQPNVEPRAG